MVARQNHGFVFEGILNDLMKDMHFNDGDYTAEDDAILTLTDKKRNFSRNIRVSAKAIRKNGEICLGSLDRIIENDDPLLVFIAHYTDANYIENSRVDVYYLPSGFTDLFGYNKEEIKELCNNFRALMKETINFNDKSFDDEWAEARRAFQEQYRALSYNGEGDIVTEDVCDDTDDDGDGIPDYNYILPRPKRDHKNQRRLQCCIPKKDKAYFLLNYGVLTFYVNDLTIFDLQDLITDNGYIDDNVYQCYEYDNREALETGICYFITNYIINNGY